MKLTLIRLQLLDCSPEEVITGSAETTIAATTRHTRHYDTIAQCLLYIIFFGFWFTPHGRAVAGPCFNLVSQQ
jgi:hypothetical protein